MTKEIRVCVVGVGSVVSNFVEGLAYYRLNATTDGIIFDEIFGYDVSDISLVCGFDIASNKIGKPIYEAIYVQQNKFVKNPHLQKDERAKNILKKIASGIVYPGILSDNKEYALLLRRQGIGVTTASNKLEIKKVLEENEVDVVVNLIPTGSNITSREYAYISLDANVAFVNGIPAKIFRDAKIRRAFLEKNLPLLGDDLKSQVGTTIVHRSILSGLTMRGMKIGMTSQINMGGNMDFLNLESKSESKIASKKYALSLYTETENAYVRNIYAAPLGPIKIAYIEVIGRVFGGSPVKLFMRLESDDKANAAGCIADLVRFAKGLNERSAISEDALNFISAFYMKSPAVQVDDRRAYEYLRGLLSNEDGPK